VNDVSGWAGITSSASLAATRSMKSSRGRRLAASARGLACSAAAGGYMDGVTAATPCAAGPGVWVGAIFGACPVTRDFVVGALCKPCDVLLRGGLRAPALGAATGQLACRRVTAKSRRSNCTGRKPATSSPAEFGRSQAGSVRAAGQEWEVQPRRRGVQRDGAVLRASKCPFADRLCPIGTRQSRR